MGIVLADCHVLTMAMPMGCLMPMAVDKADRKVVPEPRAATAYLLVHACVHMSIVGSVAVAFSLEGMGRAPLHGVRT